MDIGCETWLQKIRPKLPIKLGRVLDVGSLNINGSAKKYFLPKDCEKYIGIDMQAGKDVDIVANAHDLEEEFGTDAFDVVICMNTLEHDNKFWLTLEAINKVLKKGGYFVFGSPTYSFPIHYHPDDYYRFLESAVRQVVMEGYEILDLEEVYSKREPDPSYKKGWKGINPIICALGRKK